MKKLLLFIFFLCMMILCISCSKHVQSSENDSYMDVKSRTLSSEELYPPLDIEKKLLIDENGCKVYIPYITDEKYSDVNNKIESFITERIDGVMETGWDDKFHINIDYEISYNQNQLLSFYFLEESFIGFLEHMYLNGFNFDMQSGELIPITDLIDVDEAFLDELFSYRGDMYGREEYISDYLMENYEKDKLLEMIKNETGVSYYFSNDYIYVSFPLTQALTFHMEFGIKWEYERLSQ